MEKEQPMSEEVLVKSGIEESQEKEEGGEPTIKAGSLEDLDELVKVDKDAFPPNWPDDLVLKEDQFKSCLETFPEGFFVASLNSRIVGYIAVTIIQLDLEQETPNWYQLTDNGYIKKSHNNSGNTVTGVSLAVDREFQKKGIGEALTLQVVKIFSQYENIERGIIGSRLPGLVESGLGVNEYYEKVKKREINDPTATFYLNMGFEPVKLAKDFIKDPPSGNWALIMKMEKSDAFRYFSLLNEST